MEHYFNVDNKNVIVQPYNLKWKKFFLSESNKLKKLLHPYLHRLHHIGSTAIPGMLAEPVIDMLGELTDIEAICQIESLLKRGGYLQMTQIIPHRSYFLSKVKKNIAYNLYIYERADPLILRYLRFREYMKKNVHEAEAYAKLKMEIAKTKHYAFAKRKFIKTIDAKAKQFSLAHLKINTQLRNLKRKISIKKSEEKIIQALEANIYLLMTYFGNYIAEIEFISKPEFTLVDAGLRERLFNGVLSAHLSEVKIEFAIQEIINYFSKRKLPFSWWVCPSDSPYYLSDKLWLSGLIKGSTNMGMYLDLDKWEYTVKDPKITFQKVTTSAQFKDFALVRPGRARAFVKYFSEVSKVYSKDDPMEFYVGYIDGQAVTRGALVCYANVASIHYMATKHTERRKGYATLLGNYLLMRAKELGYHVVVLQATTRGLTLYKKTGFKPCCVIRRYVYP